MATWQDRPFFVVHTTTGGGTDWAGASTCAGGQPRETAYSVHPNLGWTSIYVTVDGASADDVMISFLDGDVGCDGSEIVCVDEVGTNVCEAGFATEAELGTGYITFVVSSTAIGTALTTRIRVD